MSELFIKIFNLGVTAGWLVLAILLCRPLMRRVPKWINCLLWGIVGFRLVFPFSLESIFSLVPSAEPLPEDIMLSPAPAINSGVGVLNNAINPMISESMTPAVGASVNPMQIVIAVAAWVWVIGIALMLGYGIASYISLRLKVRVSVRGEGKAYFCDDVDSPFILGIVRPRIYVPSTMQGEALDHVLAHERAHLRRGDHLWKPIGFALLAIYWFNPLLWAAYALLCRDIEAACDEKVIKEMPDEAKKSYSEALLACSLHRKRIMACPLAFGEVGVKRRIRSVLNYKKPAFRIIVAALVATLVLSVCFLTDPLSKPADKLTIGSEWSTRGAINVIFAVEENGEIHGYLNYDYKHYDIVLHCRPAGLVRGTRLYVEIRRGNLIDATVTEDDLLLSGSMRVHGDELVLVIDKDNLGITEYEKKLVFERVYDRNLIGSNGKVAIPAPSYLDYTLYVQILEVGSNKTDVDFELKQAFRSENDIMFTIEWYNDSEMMQSIEPDFSIFRYDGDKLVELDVILTSVEESVYPVENDAVIGIMPGSGSTQTYNITGRYDISTPGKYRFECNGAWVEFEVVREEKNEIENEQHLVFDPAYFAYDSSRKYDVYVWQMAKGSFSFGMLESKTRTWLDDELMDLRGVGAAEMRQILLKSNLGTDDVNIVIWQNPLSSYIGDYGMRWTAMDDVTPQQNMYMAMIYDMLFGTSSRSIYPTVYEFEYFDIDGDGEKEQNVVALGLKDGVFEFSYLISDDGASAGYCDTFYTAPMSLKFFTSDGKLRLRGVTEDGAAHIYAIALEGGHVKLTEIEIPHPEMADGKLDLSKADLSLVDRIVITDGTTGEKYHLTRLFSQTLFSELFKAVKTIKATDPVSSRGYYGFTYHVALYCDYQSVFSFALCPEGDGASITCGYYETVGNFDYAARYKLTEPTYEKLDEVLGKYFK